MASNLTLPHELDKSIKITSKEVGAINSSLFLTQEVKEIVLFSFIFYIFLYIVCILIDLIKNEFK